ncbi:MAG: Ig-like domain-containing protein [Propionibacteriaceae bacterium]|jgi:2-hydroxy-3-keto-5-methylthiopentenyl-1-phosphate phosphatase|nr:Ig-like domain-containing protein [Propionibacteriaceae bacterium]
MPRKTHIPKTARAWLVALLATLGLLAASAGAATPAPALAPVPMATGSLGADQLVIAPGQVYTATATVEWPFSSAPSVAWKSSNAKLVTVAASTSTAVDSNNVATFKAVVTAKKTGSAKVTVTVKDSSGDKWSAALKVKIVVKPTKVALSAAKKTLRTGSTWEGAFKSVSPSKAYKGLLWKSSNPKVASVDDAGAVTALKAGTTTITATSPLNKAAKAAVKVTVKPAALKKLAANNWAPKTRAAINRFMGDYGYASKTYDTAKKPYVVFDFDNTTSFFDVEEALLVYQLENLRFKIPRADMAKVLTSSVPTTPLADDYKNAAGASLDVATLAADCQKDYEWLYDNYAGFGVGSATLGEVRTSLQYSDFTTKVRFLYEAINGTFDAATGYPWVTYLFTGMTPAEVSQLAVDSTDYWLAHQTWGTVTWTSPGQSAYPTAAGEVSVTYKTSIAIPPESKDLYKKLMANGFDVYICSASFIDVIEALAYNPKYGLNVPEGHVLAMELNKDANGKYLPEYNYTLHDQTQGKGKKTSIDKLIRPLYDGRGPRMVAGDSAGDYQMITGYKSMKLGLIINRVRKASDPISKVSAQAAATIGQADAKYVLQGRDENTGKYRKSEKSILLGSDTPKLLP